MPDLWGIDQKSLPQNFVPWKQFEHSPSLFHLAAELSHGTRCRLRDAILFPRPAPVTGRRQDPQFLCRGKKKKEDLIIILIIKHVYFI